MRGKVEPGALCLVTYGLWAGAAVRVVGEPPWSFLLMMRHLCPSLYPWWQVEVTDGVPRETINTIGELLGPKTSCFMLEKHLMPLDPGPDVATVDELVQGFFDKHVIKRPVVVGRE